MLYNITRCGNTIRIAQLLFVAVQLFQKGSFGAANTDDNDGEGQLGGFANFIGSNGKIIKVAVGD